MFEFSAVIMLLCDSNVKVMVIAAKDKEPCFLRYKGLLYMSGWLAGWLVRSML